jgi:hypothetical protein
LSFQGGFSAKGKNRRIFVNFCHHPENPGQTPRDVPIFSKTALGRPNFCTFDRLNPIENMAKAIICRSRKNILNLYIIFIR